VTDIFASVPVEKLAEEINQLLDEAQQALGLALLKFKELGDRLRHIKEKRVPHGGWLKWLAANFRHRSATTAEKYMRLSEHWETIRPRFEQDPGLALDKALALVKRTTTRQEPPQCPAAQLLAALEKLAPVVARRGYVEQSGHFVFKGGHVFAEDDGLRLWLPVPLNVFKAVAVPGKRLLRLLKQLQHEKVRLQAVYDTLTLATETGAGTDAWEIDGVPLDLPDGYPGFDLAAPAPWRPLPEGFAAALGEAARCAVQYRAAAFHGEPMAMVHIHPKFVEATDDYRAYRRATRTGFAEPCLLSHDHAALAASLDVVEFACTDAFVFFRNAGKVVMACAKPQKPYPKLDDLFAAGGSPLQLPAGFAAAVEAAASLADRHSPAESGGPVDVRISPGRLCVASNYEGGWSNKTFAVSYGGPDVTIKADRAVLARLAALEGDCFVTPHGLAVRGVDFVYVVAGAANPAADRDADCIAATPAARPDDESDDDLA
jgi:hypothetical protein